ncbi:MAG: hypothetical protein QM770_01920 [Tepidisphaeraceae bacterium]
MAESLPWYLRDSVYDNCIRVPLYGSLLVTAVSTGIVVAWADDPTAHPQLLIAALQTANSLSAVVLVAELVAVCVALAGFVLAMVVCLQAITCREAVVVAPTVARFLPARLRGDAMSTLLEIAAEEKATGARPSAVLMRFLWRVVKLAIRLRLSALVFARR